MLTRKAGLEGSDPGQIMEVTPDSGLSHDNADMIREIFNKKIRDGYTLDMAREIAKTL